MNARVTSDSTPGFSIAATSVRGGFTLIELLVVIAVVGLLAMMLLPALSRAKEKAERIQCISAKKQWAMAFRIYVDEHDGLIPREGYRRLGGVEWDNWIQVKGRNIAPDRTDSDDVWYNALPEHAGVPPASAYAPVNKHADFYSGSSLFHCPSAKFPPYVTKPSYIIAIFSIAMNSQLIEFPHGPTINFARIQDEESRTVLFLDNLLEGEKKVDPHQENDNLGQPAAYADRFSARHSKGGNLAFADGHVQWFPGNKVVETNPESPLRGWPVMPPVDIIWEPKHDF
jgi:prepilin-type N-terminal cleavage/methylation domain-containing protein/prepilin-type processing-associated H-X9-DG protein